MEDQKAQLLAKLRDSANVLVTVTANPSVDQLAGAIGLTLLLNKLGKHATAIFSGNVPDVMEFLKPEATLEQNTDSLRDFIIALDKAKADKLRYKVEDTMVKIFITPYHTALSEHDLEFSLGDYNVDLVVALGAHAQQDLDKAIISHGQILHDAVISSINNGTAGNLGTINWVDDKASSLCEMVFDLCHELQPDGLDPQMATSLLTGIVSETRRFGNDKTTAKSLETSSLLVAAGANQQLVAAKLEEKPAPIPEKKAVAKPAAPAEEDEQTATDTHKDPEAVPQKDGTVTIDHSDEKADEDDVADINIDEQGKLQEVDEPETAPVEVTESTEPEATPSSESRVEGGSKLLTDEPSARLSEPGFMPAAETGPAVDPLAPTTAVPLLSHASGPAKLPGEEDATPTAVPSAVPLTADESAATPNLDSAREAVNNVANTIPDLVPKPSAALNAQHIDLDTPTPEEPPAEPAPTPSMTFTQPATALVPDTPPADNTASPMEDPTAPPPVPPPMPMPSFAAAPAAPAEDKAEAPKTPKPDFSAQAL